jgi:serine/threonine protein kinase/WD40 repeat protein
MDDSVRSEHFMTLRVSPPSDETLQAFDRGLLSPDEIDSVTRWLEAHPEVEERLRRLADGSPDTAVEALRKPCALAEELAGLSGLTSSVVDRILSGSEDAPGKAAEMPDRIRDYQLLRPLGRGGMGGVYVARHTRLHRDVALKVLLAHAANDPTYRARFEREMAVVGQLDHPHLIRAHDAGAEGDHLFLVMELLDGRDLACLVAEGGPLSLADACEVVRQAALGLHHAHEHGLVHRDVKPANLFLTRAGVVKVIDLGLARVTDDAVAGPGVSTADRVLGTPECMAPEQWENSAVDRRADLYALGCTLFLLLTGRAPFTPKTPKSWVAWMDAHRWQTPPELREQLPEAPAPLAQLMGKLLAKEPQQRPATAFEVAERLAPWTSGHSIGKIDLSPATTPVPRLAKGSLKHRRRRLAIAGALLLAAVPSIWYFTRPSPAPQGQDTVPLPGAQAHSSDPAPSLYLSGVDHVELANTAGMTDLNGAFSVEMWAKFDKVTQYFVGDEIWVGSTRRAVTRTHGWVLRIDNGRMDINLAETTKDWADFIGPEVNFDDQWHHIAVSKDAKILRVFLDGAAYLTADTANLQFVNSPMNLFIGPNNAISRSINCSFRAFRVSDKPLYAAPFTPPREFAKTKDTLVLLDFSQGHAGVNMLPDRSGNGHNGLITGGRWSSYLRDGTIPRGNDQPPKDPSTAAAGARAPAGPQVVRPNRTLQQHANGVLTVVFSPNGKILASAGKDRTITLWDVDSWQIRGTLSGHPGDIVDLAFTPDGGKLASVTSSADRCYIRLWDVATAKPAGTLGGQSSGIWGVAWSPDSSLVTCGGWDKALHVFDAATGEQRLAIPDIASNYVRALAFSPKGDLIVAGGTGPARLWETKTGREIPTSFPEYMCPSFLPTGDGVVGWTYGQGSVTICDVPSGKVRATWRAHAKFIEGLAVSPDGRFLASLGDEGLVRLWATADQTELATLIGHKGIVYTAAFTPDGAHLATAGMDDSTVRIWDLPPECHVRK